MSAVHNSPLRVVITDCDHDNIEPELRVFDEAGFEVKLAGCKTSADVIEQAREAEAIINQYAPIDEAALAGLERCRVVVRYGVGVETVDVEAASRRGVWVANVPDYGVEEVSDHALALMLNLLRWSAQLDRAVRSGVWDYSAVRPLHRIRTLTVGVVGCGRESMEFPWDEALFRAIDIHFSFSSSYTSWDGALSLMRSGAVNVEPLTTMFPLEKWKDAFHTLENRQVVKAILTPQPLHEDEQQSVRAGSRQEANK